MANETMPEQAEGSATQEQSGQRRALLAGRPARGRRLPEVAALVVVLLGMGIFFTLTSPDFFNSDNFLNIVVNVAVIGVVACPATLLLISGQFDLSVGSGAAFVGVVMAWAAALYSIPVAVALAVLAALGIGLVNALSVTVLGVNALITTLATLAIFRGLAQVIAGGQTLLLPNFDALGTGRPAGIPVPAIIFVIVIAVFSFLLRYTVYGRSMCAIGANPAAARLAGIHTKRVLFIGFMLSGVCVAIGGLILVSQLGAASPTAATGLELSVVTAVILGGASLQGGRGTIAGTVLGVLILGVLNNGLILLNVQTFWQDVARGTLLLGAVAFDQLRLRFSPVQ